MEHKKAREVNLEKKRPQFLALGLCVSLSILLVAFNYRTVDKMPFEDPFDQAVLVEDEDPIPVVILKDKPPKPKIKIERGKTTAINTEPVVIEISIGKTEKSWDKILGSEEYPDDLFVEEEDDKEFIPAPPREWVEKMPSFVGGEKMLFKYLAEKLRYPPQAKDAGIEGNVYIEFVVEKDGSITNQKIHRGIGGGCEEAALEAVKHMPRWIPGKQGGKNVRVLFRLPVKFRLNN